MEYSFLGPTLMEYGTDAQKNKFLNAMATGDHVWAQGWSEPGAGSDMAAIRTTAVLEDGFFVINGQKTWSSRAAYADWTFGLFRTDLESERHHGLSFILAPLDLPGITVRPIPQLDGEPGFAEIYFDDVKVPVENLIGGEGEGWKIAMATAGFERGLMLRSPARFQQTAAKLLSLYLENESTCSPAIQAKIVDAWAQSESYALSIYHTASKLMDGGSIGSESSLGKIFWSELDYMMHETALCAQTPLFRVYHVPYSAPLLKSCSFQYAHNHCPSTIISSSNILFRAHCYHFWFVLLPWH